MSEWGTIGATMSFGLFIMVALQEFTFFAQVVGIPFAIFMMYKLNRGGSDVESY